MLQAYEKETAMTCDERRELLKWVASGNSPYENGYSLYAENGFLMDFVNAGRCIEEQIEWYQGLRDCEKQALT